MEYQLARLLRDPAACLTFSDQDWDLLIPQARNSSLLATVYVLLGDAGILDSIPERPRNHLFSDHVIHEKQIAALNYEMKWLARALQPLGAQFVLLKGAAYIRAQLAAGRGRKIGDIDLLVPEASLTEVEQALEKAGYEGGHKDEYDERYYREWMHEIPPLTHRRRGSTLDVHHTIIPPTASPLTEASKLFPPATQLPDGSYVLSPEDIVIHSATHLFHEGEFHNGFRDVFDLDRLLRDFGASQPGFWSRLVPRADELDLLKSVFYALRYANRIFATPVPPKVLFESRKAIVLPLLIPLMDFLFMRALAPDHTSCNKIFTGAAQFSLYIRSHYLRMPLKLLIPHLFRKARKRYFPDTKETEGSTP